MHMSTHTNNQNTDFIKVILPKVSVKLSVGKKTAGSGVIVTPNDAELVFYIITAWHVVKSIDHVTDQLDIQFFNDEDGQVHTYQFQAGKDRLYQLEAKDIAVIEIERSILLKILPFSIPPVSTITPEFDFKDECIFRGFPNYKEQIQPFLIIGTFERIQQDRFFLDPVKPLESLSQQVEDTIEGLSGSGVFKKNIDGQFDLIGLFTDLHSGIIRLECISLIPLNKLLIDSGRQALNLTSRQNKESNQSIINDIGRIRQESDLVLNRIIDRIGSVHLDRQSIHDQLNQAVLANQLVIITGTAGDGKSAIGKKVLSTLKHEGFDTLAFKAEFFVADSITRALQSYLLTNNLLDVLRSKALSSSIALFIDSAEKLLDQPNCDAFFDLLDWCSQHSNRKIILTCRSYAFNSLTFDFFSHFPSTKAVINVPSLSDNELELVQKEIPSISVFMKQERIYDLLHRPFFTSLAVKFTLIEQRGAEVTEKDFKQRIWDHVIEKGLPERGDILTKIARQRAKQMNLFTQVSNLNTTLTRQLFQEGIIDRHPTKHYLLAPAHDIFEDLALIRIIDQQYNRDPSLDVFFSEIGDEPAIRRAYRLWLLEELTGLHSNHDLLQFLNDVISSSELASFWKDETIIAILRSDNCSIFFTENSSVLEDNNFTLFIHFLHLLQTACQDINLSSIQTLSQELQAKYFYHDQFLTPVGSGWGACIVFISIHLEKLKNHYGLIFRFLIEKWGKKIDPHYEFPVEASTGGELLFWFIEEYKNTFEERKTLLLDKGILLLLKLTPIFETEVEKLLNEANQYVYLFDDLKEEEQHYKLRNFYKQLLTHALSWTYGKPTAFCLPELIAKIINYRWLYRKDRVRNRLDRYYRHEDQWDTDQTHGFYIEDRFSNKTASAYQTCVEYLFAANPDVALKLIVDLANYSINYYRINTQDSNVIDCSIQVNDKTIVQYGNANYWVAYRSGHTVSNIFSSALMSLENWLLNLGKDNDIDRIIKTYEYLTQNSKCVSTSAVLVSIIIAYPEQIGYLAIPFLRNIDFLQWDKSRVSVWSHTSFMDSFIIRDERDKSDKLPHRYSSLDYIALYLQTNGYFNEISNIIDELNKVVSPKETLLRIMLKHMDSRGRKPDLDTIVKTGAGTYYQMVPNFEDDLKEILDETKIDINRTTRLASDNRWTREVSRQEIKPSSLLEEWNLKYQAYRDQLKKEKQDYTYQLFSEPALLAAIGMRDLWNQLGSQQKKWCIQTLINQFAKRQKEKKYDIQLNDALFALTIALSLPELTKSQYKKLKLIITNEVFYSDARQPLEINFLHTLGQQIWKYDRLFAQSLLKGLFAYADYKNDHTPLLSSRRHYYPENNVNPLIQLTAAGIIQFDIKSYKFTQAGMRRACRAILFIPYNTADPEYKLLVKRVLLFLINHYATQHYRDTSISPYDGVHLLHYFVANFLMNQHLNYSLSFFVEVLEVIIEREKASNLKQDRDLKGFFEDMLKQFIIVEDENQLGKLWPFWEQLGHTLKEKQSLIGISKLFLNIDWLNSLHDWKPLLGKQTLIKQWVDQFGYTEFQSVVKLIQGIGANELLPEAINWMPRLLTKYVLFLNFRAKMLQEKESGLILLDDSTLNELEELVRYIYFNYKIKIKESKQLKESFILWLNNMIGNNSSVSFIIRERIIGI